MIKLLFGSDSPITSQYRTGTVQREDTEIAWLALELNARAQQVDDVFQAKAAEIARATGALHLPGEVKDVHRIAEKLELDYRSRQGYEVADIHQLAPMVKDAARCRLVIQGDPTTEDQPIIDQIETSGLTIARDALDRPSIKRGTVRLDCSPATGEVPGLCGTRTKTRRDRAAGQSVERFPIKGRLPSTGSRPTRRLAPVMSTLHKSQLVEAMKSCTMNPSYLKSVFSTGNQI